MIGGVLTRTALQDGTASSVQALAPTTDSVDGAWTDQAGGTALAAAIDEAAASDSDYIRSELTPANSGCRILLATASEPSTNTGHVLRWRIGKDPTSGAQINMTVTLRQGGGAALGGGTQIASFTRNNVAAFTTYEETLSTAQADAIVYTTGSAADLYLEFYANQV